MSADHYFSTDPRAPARSTEVRFEVDGRTFELTGSSGVYSGGRLDPGTAVLLRKAELPGPGERGPLLDLGCGYGPIACVLATVAPAATVYAVDVNTRALELARTNAAALGVGERVVASAPDEVSPGIEFAEIWSNPPIRVGKDELHAILDRWLPRLRPGGTAWLVVGRHLGGDSLARWLTERGAESASGPLGGPTDRIQGGWHVDRHASQQGFRVLRVTRAGRRNSGDVGALDEGHS